MPLVTVSMYPGRTQEQKERYARAVTESAAEILGAKREHVIVVFEERPREDWYLAGSRL